MSCGCANTQCLDVVTPCGETVELSLQASETGTWTVLVSFNGSVWTAPISVTNGEKISIPNNLNEQYTHMIRLYKADGSLFNNTCYLLKTQSTITI